MTKVLSGERRGRSPDSSKRACSRAGYSTQIRSNGWRSRKLASGNLLTVTAVDLDQVGLRRLDVGAIGHGETVGFVDDVVGRMSG